MWGMFIQEYRKEVESSFTGLIASNAGAMNSTNPANAV